MKYRDVPDVVVHVDPFHRAAVLTPLWGCGGTVMLIPSMAQGTGKVARLRVHFVLFDSTRVGGRYSAWHSRSPPMSWWCFLADEKRVVLLDGCIIAGLMTLLAPLRRTETHAVLAAAVKTCVANRNSSDACLEASEHLHERKELRGRLLGSGAHSIVYEARTCERGDYSVAIFVFFR